MTQQILLIGLNVCWQITALALVALGLAIVFGLLRILNMAHGEFFMLGAYSHIFTSELNLPSILTFPICFVLVGSTALLVERLVVRHLYDRIFDSLLATWGISILIREIVEMIWQIIQKCSTTYRWSGYFCRIRLSSFQAAGDAGDRRFRTDTLSLV